MKRLGVIDIGTQSVIMLLAEQTDNQKINIVEQSLKSPRLGEGISGGVILDKPLKRTIEVLSGFLDSLQKNKAEKIITIGTRVFRAAANSAAACAEIEAKTGQRVQVLSCKEEAGFGFSGAVQGLSSETGITVLDIGGGSTEIISGQGGRIVGWQSLPLGAVVLTEKMLKSPVFRADYSELNRRLLGSTDLVGVGGTVTALACLDLNLVEYDASAVDGHILSLKRIKWLLGRLQSLPLHEQRRLLAFDPQRVDILPAGVLILLKLMTTGNYDQIQVRDQGVRMGAALYEFDKAGNF